jgi:hypothetical protein
VDTEKPIELPYTTKDASPVINALKGCSYKTAMAPQANEITYVQDSVIIPSDLPFEEVTMHVYNIITASNAMVMHWQSSTDAHLYATADVSATTMMYAAQSASMSLYDQLQHLLSTIPQAKYAIQNPDGDWDFYQIKQTKQKTYWLYRLQGAPGDWNRIWIKITPALKIAKLIGANPKAAAFAYSEQHEECSACGAKLSVAKSITQAMGPVCIKKFAGWS